MFRAGTPSLAPSPHTNSLQMRVNFLVEKERGSPTREKHSIQVGAPPVIEGRGGGGVSWNSPVH